MDKQKKILLRGNINRKIWNAKQGATLSCTSEAEADIVYRMAKKVGVDVSRRGAQVKFHSEIDREKYEWMSGKPAKSNVKPSLGSVK